MIDSVLEVFCFRRLWFNMYADKYRYLLGSMTGYITIGLGRVVLLKILRVIFLKYRHEQNVCPKIHVTGELIFQNVGSMSDLEPRSIPPVLIEFMRFTSIFDAHH